MIGTSIYREDSVLWAKSAYSPSKNKIKFDAKRLDGRFIIHFGVSPVIKYYSISVKEERYDFDPFYSDKNKKWVSGKKVMQKDAELFQIPKGNIVQLKTYFIISSQKLTIGLFDKNKTKVYEWQNTDPITFKAASSSLLLRIKYKMSKAIFEISDVSDLDSFEIDQIIDIDNGE